MIDQAEIHTKAYSSRAEDRQEAAELFEGEFSELPDTPQAWRDLIRLTQDQNSNVRRRSVDALKFVFPHLTDKIQGWKDLHVLIQNRDEYLRRGIANALGLALTYLPDKPQVWEDLIRLTQDEDAQVRTYAYYSLGRAYVLKATKNENKDAFREDLSAAITYFEKSSKQQALFNPADFCLPFYRSYYAITFQGDREDEIKKYLGMAKQAVGGSESRAELLESVENLAKALQGSRNLKDKSLEEIVNELNAYRWYCEKAAEHLATAEESAPGAVELMRRCNPLLEERIQAIIIEIQKKAQQICQTTGGSGSKFESLATDAKSLSTGDIVESIRASNRIVTKIREFCGLLPESEKSLVLGLLEGADQETDFR